VRSTQAITSPTTPFELAYPVCVELNRSSYGIAAVATSAGVKVATTMRAMNRGLFSLGDLRSVAAYVLRKDKRRKGQGKPVARESGREIRERLARGSKVEALP